MLTAISPIDGRYARQSAPLKDYFSEYALIRYRVLVEIHYFMALCDAGLPQLAGVTLEHRTLLERIANQFNETEAQKIKEIEKVTNHDVKAVEYYLKQQCSGNGMDAFLEFIHFGLTSQDINNTATPLMLKHAHEQVYLPQLLGIKETLRGLAMEWKNIPLLARTHGQPASPTTLGKEIMVFVARLDEQIRQLNAVPFSAKFGGATGNMNAHYVAYPNRDWHAFAQQFVEQNLGLTRSMPTTQIEHYDNLAAYFHAVERINTILLDLCKDVWTYISMDYFKQKTKEGEIGSSAMPHKVNPIDFENAEGNLGIANALLIHLAAKLPISRLQRDLTDSTVLRNIGVPMAHTVIAFNSIARGLDKLLLHEAKIQQDLEDNWMVVAEGIQTVLRREGYPQPYEALKALTRGKQNITGSLIHEFIEQLDVSDVIKSELKQISPSSFIGNTGF